MSGIPNYFLIKYLNISVKKNTRIVDISYFKGNIKNENFNDKKYLKKKFHVLYAENQYEPAVILMIGGR